MDNSKEKPRMSRVCVVPGCPSGRNVPSHMFPKDPEVSLKWRELVKSPQLSGLTTEEIGHNYCVCYRHFSDDCYVPGYQVRRMRPGSLPSLHIPAQTDDMVEQLSTVTVVNEEVGQQTLPIDVDGLRMQDDKVVNQSLSSVDNDNLKMQTVEVAEQSSSDPSTKEGNIENSIINETGNKVNDDLEQLHARTSEDVSNERRNSFDPLPEEQQRVADKLIRRINLKCFNDSNLNEKGKQLLKISYALKKRVDSCQRQIRQLKYRIKQLKAYHKSTGLEAALERVTKNQKMVIEMQLRCSQQEPNVRRFSKDERKLALSMYKQSPSCYRFLRRILCLPSPGSLEIFRI